MPSRRKKSTNPRQGMLPGVDDPVAAAPTPTATIAAPPEGPTEGHSEWVIDAPGLIYRRFHAMPDLTNPEGVPTGALRGFVDDVLQILAERKPDYLFCCFDAEGPTFRHEMYPDYKGHRDETPIDLVPQLPLIREFLEIFDIPALELLGYEADDLLATIARETAIKGGACTIVSSDKDCRQLLTDRVFLFNAAKRKMFSIEDLAAEWGVRPDQVVDFQALTGDSVDNVPGVPLIGPKAAQTLLGEFATLDEVLAAAAEGRMKKSKKQENLVTFREQALLSQQLCLLNDTVPIELPWDQARPGNVDLSRAEAFFQRMEFRSHTDHVRRLNLSTASVTWDHEYHTVDTPEALSKFVAALSEQPRFAVDTETTGLKPRDADLVGLSFAWNEGTAYYLPLQGPEGDRTLPADSTLEALRPLLEQFREYI